MSCRRCTCRRLLLWSRVAIIAVVANSGVSAADPWPASSHGISPASHTRPAFPEIGQRTEVGVSKVHSPSAAPSDRPRSIELQRPQETARSASNSDRDQSRTTASPWTTVGAFTFVMAIIFLCAHVWKRYASHLPTTLSGDVVEILGRRPIDQRHGILLVRCGARILILGTSASGFQTLAEVTDPVEMDYLAGLCRKPGEPGQIAQTFRQLLARGATAGSTNLGRGATAAHPGFSHAAVAESAAGLEGPHA